MKVLIKTVTKRKGYKNFKDIDGLNEFLNENRKKIKSYKILKEARIEKAVATQKAKPIDRL